MYPCYETENMAYTGYLSGLEISATVDGTLRLRNPFGTAKVDWNRNVKTGGNDIVVELKTGQTLTGEVK